MVDNYRPPDEQPVPLVVPSHVEACPRRMLALHAAPDSRDLPRGGGGSVRHHLPLYNIIRANEGTQLLPNKKIRVKCDTNGLRGGT